MAIQVFAVPVEYTAKSRKIYKTVLQPDKHRFQNGMSKNFYPLFA
jgi:hypothetical protein